MLSALIPKSIGLVPGWRNRQPWAEISKRLRRSDYDTTDVRQMTFQVENNVIEFLAHNKRKLKSLLTTNRGGDEHETILDVHRAIGRCVFYSSGIPISISRRVVDCAGNNACIYRAGSS